MFDSQHGETEQGTPDSELLTEFVTWLQHVTQAPTEYRPRHRAEVAAG